MGTIAPLVGKYDHVRSENLEKYFAAIGVPYLARKIIASTAPSLEIIKSENGQWTILVHTFIRTITVQFTPGEEFEEHMPFGHTMKSIATMNDEILHIDSTIVESGIRMSRFYTWNAEGCIITLNYKDEVTAKRFFRRTS